jgi:hypothetical protein
MTVSKTPTLELTKTVRGAAPGNPGEGDALKLGELSELLV